MMLAARQPLTKMGPPQTGRSNKLSGATARLDRAFLPSDAFLSSSFPRERLRTRPAPQRCKIMTEQKVVTQNDANPCDPT